MHIHFQILLRGGTWGCEKSWRAFSIIVFYLRLRDLWINPYELRKNKSFTNFVLQNQIHDTNLLKTGRPIESTTQIFWTPYRFATLNPTDLYIFVLFIVCLFTKDSSGFGKICWICKNRPNLLQIGRICDPQFETNLIKSGFVIHDMNRIQILGSQTKTNL
jgi:hypothetical protein